MGTWANLTCAQGSLRVGRVQHISSVGAQDHWLGALQVVGTEEVLLTDGLCPQDKHRLPSIILSPVYAVLGLARCSMLATGWSGSESQE